MYIKNIVISGFRSYREQAFPEEFTPKHNVIVGKNGSGKSNFFNAIQFVLSEKFANLRANERKDLFHVGAGRPALSVFVEIVFDNTDGRLVIPGRPEEPEVRIRRTLGLKQDEYRVNDRRFLATEVKQLLESAGFSASNPYYIVEQGKIVNLASMREEERYQLLKDVAGTKVYEARRKDSEGILEETSARHVKIDEAIGQLESRLKELEAETSELKAFQEQDRRRKCLEYAIYNAELSRAKEELEQLDADWAARMRSTEAHLQGEEAQQQQLRDAALRVEECTKRAHAVEQRRKMLDADRSEATARRAMADLKAADAKGLSARDEAERKALYKEESDVSKSLSKNKAELQSKKKTHQGKQAEAAAAADKLNADEARLNVLQAKVGRKHQFKTRAERDAWIKDELARNERLVEQNAKEQAQLEKEAKANEDMVARDQAQLKEDTSHLNRFEASRQAHRKKAQELVHARDKLNMDRHKHWQLVHEQESVVRRCTDASERAKSRLERATRSDIRLGWQSLQEVLGEINDSGFKKAVHGRVIELIEVDAAAQTAVEVSAGNALFNVVVDSFDASARILDHMNRRKKPGRVTFFPLDTCKPFSKDLPTSSDYSPLVSHVKFEKKFKSVMTELFGRTVLARTLEAGAAACKELDCDAITVDGDQFNRKGGITGGFVDTRFSKLGALAESKRCAAELAKEKSKLETRCQDVAAVEHDITAIIQQIDKANADYSNERSSTDLHRHDARAIQDRTVRLQQHKAQEHKAQESLRHASAQLKHTLQALSEERKTDFKDKLSKDEADELDRLQNDTARMRNDVSKLSTAALQLGTDVQLLEDTVQHLEHRLRTVQDRSAELAASQSASATGGASSSSAESQEYNNDVKAIDDELKMLDSQLAALDKQMDTIAQERRKHEESAESARIKIIGDARDLQNDKDKVDRAHNQRSLLQQRKDDAQGKIRRLGIIPPDVEQYTAHSMGKLMHILKQTNDELKKYGHVNKKAIDQYTALVETRNDLKEKRQSLETELASITQLMEHLDRQKGEAIERTYKQVQFQFESVFRSLVTTDGVHAQLQLVKNTAAAAGSAGGGKDKQTASADPFSAVRINVSFGLGAPVSELSALSGGQKSLVALALIFAIQRCDPAPFYLFDEIDAALDAEYRTSVARFIQATEDCQFITATFKTEMLAVADRVYGIFFHNKVSKMRTLTQDEGQGLLKQAAAEEKSKRVRAEEEEEGNLGE